MHATAKSYYRILYHEACDLLIGELEKRFENQHVHEVLSIEHVLMKAANGDDFHTDMRKFEESCFVNDIDLSDLSKELPLLCDWITLCEEGDFSGCYL